jgi:predicted transposase YdaD
MAEGSQEGLSEEIERGIEQGSLQSRDDVARKMPKRNIPVHEIRELTDLTTEEVHGLKL